MQPACKVGLFSFFRQGFRLTHFDVFRRSICLPQERRSAACATTCVHPCPLVRFDRCVTPPAVRSPLQDAGPGVTEHVGVPRRGSSSLSPVFLCQSLSWSYAGVDWCLPSCVNGSGLVRDAISTFTMVGNCWFVDFLVRNFFYCSNILFNALFSVRSSSLIAWLTWYFIFLTLHLLFASIFLPGSL